MTLTEIMCETGKDERDATRMFFELQTQGCNSCRRAMVVSVNWHGQFCRGCADALDPASPDFDHGY